MKSLIAALTLALLSTAALAESGTCSASANGQRLRVNFTGNLTGGEGVVLLNGRVISRFERGEARINLLNQSMSGRNGYGDVVRARVTNIVDGSGLVEQLTIPSADIDWRNVPVYCTLYP
jgi:hypothetical protein